MDSPIIYEYSIIRYLPRVERGEAINVGLAMMSKRHRWLRTAIHIDPERLRHFDPATDIERLRHTLTLFTRCDCPDATLPVEERYRWLTAVKSAIIQPSPSHPGIIADTEGLSPAEMLESTFDLLMADMVL